MTLIRFVLPALLLLAANPADARPRRGHHGHVVVGGPRVSVVINPWGPAYVPAARPGWVWVAGAWVGPRWRPGYWQPAVARVGWLWVPGYWAGTVYVDGYWREEVRSGQTWVDGYYEDGGDWVPGYWAPAGSADAARDASPPPSQGGGPPETNSPEAGSTPVYHDYE
jgi:hypothetical protein